MAWTGNNTNFIFISKQIYLRTVACFLEAHNYRTKHFYRVPKWRNNMSCKDKNYIPISQCRNRCFVAETKNISSEKHPDLGEQFIGNQIFFRMDVWLARAEYEKPRIVSIEWWRCWWTSERILYNGETSALDIAPCGQSIIQITVKVSVTLIQHLFMRHNIKHLLIKYKIQGAISNTNSLILAFHTSFIQKHYVVILS